MKKIIVERCLQMIGSLKIVFERATITFFSCLMLTSLAACQNSADVDWLIDVLELKEGEVVAEIGAGDGDETLAIAEYIGPNGRIYSSELGSDSIEELRDEIDDAEVSNVTVVEGHPNRTNLPDECCDAIFMRRVYHHFKDPAAMNESLLQSLKPGGRLAVIDFEPRDSEADPSSRASGGSHGVTNETVVEELKQAGFKLISSDQRSGRDIYVVMEKPAED